MSDMVDQVAAGIYIAEKNASQNVWSVLAEPVRDNYRRLARAAIDALNLTEEWGVQIRYMERVISDNPLDREAAEAVVAHNHTGTAFLASRWLSPWVRAEGQR